MSKNIINTTFAPAPIGPYNQAVKTGNLLFVSGQIALNAATGQLITDNIEAEAKQVMQNIEAILTAAGMTWANVLKTTIFLKDMNNFAAVNTIYGSYFKSDFPARETVEISGLPRNVNVEISVIAGEN
jgi:2-iminobutanoate/2-iminopropanoate deaminase